MTPLCSVCYQGNFEIADILLKSGARVNIADDKKTLPLHYAARNGNLKLVEELIRRGSVIILFHFSCFCECFSNRHKENIASDVAAWNVVEIVTRDNELNPNKTLVWC